MSGSNILIPYTSAAAEAKRLLLGWAGYAINLMTYCTRL